LGTASLESAALDTGILASRVLSRLAPKVQESRAGVSMGQMPLVWSDERMLERVFESLLDNALKFRKGPEPRLELGAESRPEEWLFWVKDDGIGLEPRFYGRIFGVFQTLHPQGRYPGVGMGLALCKRALERLGGRIWCESAPEQGATFFFTLPRLSSAGRPDGHESDHPKAKQG
jgi:light-regulated signal transduction histidine kinase (bacteriophytochrome)